MRLGQFDVETAVAAARAAGTAVPICGFSGEEEFLGHG
jgi:hypothetical protein